MNCMANKIPASMVKLLVTATHPNIKGIVYMALQKQKMTFYVLKEYMPKHSNK